MRKTGALAGASTLVAALWCTLALATGGSRTSGATKVIRIDLKDYGWQKLPPVAQYFLSSPPLAVDAAGEVFAGFTTGGSPRLATRQHPGLAYHILRFSDGGRLSLALVLPTDNYHGNGIYLDPRGDLIARVDGKLQTLRAEDLAHAAPSSWKILASCGPDCQIAQSPSRRTLFFGAFPGASEGYWATVSVLRFDPGRGLRLSETCRERAPDFSRTTGDKFMYSTLGGGYGMPPPRLIRRPLCDYGRQTESSAALAGGVVWPLTGGTVAITSGVESDGSIAAIASQAVSGKVKFVVTLPKEENAETSASSVDGRRLAVSIARWRGGSRWLDISGHVASRSIVVYSATTGQKLASIAVSPRLYGPGGGPAIAMSPDGRVVAALVDSVLTVAKVP